MQNTQFLINFFNNETEAGHSLHWPDYALHCSQFAEQLASNVSLEQVIANFKNSNFEHKQIFLETLEQDAERPDLAAMLGADWIVA